MSSALYSRGNFISLEKLDGKKMKRKSWTGFKRFLKKIDLILRRKGYSVLGTGCLEFKFRRNLVLRAQNLQILIGKD